MITWLPGAGPAPTGYQLEAAVSPSGAAVASVPVVAAALTATDVPDGTYFVRVRAANAAGQPVVRIASITASRAPAMGSDGCGGCRLRDSGVIERAEPATCQMSPPLGL